MAKGTGTKEMVHGTNLQRLEGFLGISWEELYSCGKHDVEICLRPSLSAL